MADYNSVELGNTFHGWVSGKSNCEAVDVFCKTDEDCSAACQTIHSDDGFEVTNYSCDNLHARCVSHTHSTDAYALAAGDLARIMGRIKSDPEYTKTVPSNFVWLLNNNGGRTFVTKRARFYERLSFALGQITGLSAVIDTMEKHNTDKLREDLMRRIDNLQLSQSDRETAIGWVLGVVSMTRPAKKTDTAVAVSASKKTTSGAVDVFSFDHFKETTTRQLADLSKVVTSTGGKKKELSLSAAATSAATTTTTTTNTALVSTTTSFEKSHKKHNTDVKETVVAAGALAAWQSNLCNEEMNAGRPVAIFGNETTRENVAVCACVYPEYLSGPTCHQRMYRYVIDYELWEKTGYPRFLTDPVNHFKEADDVCRKLKRSATAAYDESHRAFVCITIADLVKTSLTHRGFFEPSLIIESDINLAEESADTKKKFGINWSYIDLLARLEQQNA